MNNMRVILSSVLFFCVVAHSSAAWSGEIPTSETKIYRDFTGSIRGTGTFQVATPGNDNAKFSYSLKMGAPIFTNPIAYDFFMSPELTTKIRHFWDKISLQDGSALTVGNQSIPLTCIYISGEDNRFSGKNSPLLPDFILKVYLVANDFTCTGPINPGWPGNGQKEESWDTYVYFEVRDPTIMLPTESKLRYRWNEYQAFVIDQGGH